MHRVFLLIIETCRACVAGLSTGRCRVPAIEKLLRGALLVPVFGTMLALLRLRARLRGTLAVRATTRFGATFDCRLPDFIQTYLYLFGIWEPDVTAFVRRRLGPGDTFVDVGANIGYHVMLAARQLDGSGRVVAIESSPRIYRLLEATLAHNGQPAGVRTVNMAAAERVGALPLYEGPAKNIGRSTTVETRGFSREGEIPAAPLADLLEPEELATARLVKIDVEGAEDAVLRGMTEFLARCPENIEIVVELSPRWWRNRQQTPQQVLQPLIEAGFHAYRIDNNLWPWRYLWPDDVRSPRRIRGSLTKRVRRLDLVLSRVDEEEL